MKAWILMMLVRMIISPLDSSFSILSRLYSVVSVAVLSENAVDVLLSSTFFSSEFSIFLNVIFFGLIVIGFF